MSAPPENEQTDKEQAAVANRELLRAVDFQNYERIDLCLQKGAAINTRWGDGTTPVMKAIRHESPSMLAFLLTKKPDLFLKDSQGKTAFDLLEKVQDSSARNKLTDLLLKALPDAKTKNETAEQFDVAAQKEVRLARPITLAPKESPKKPAGDDGGFKL